MSDQCNDVALIDTERKILDRFFILIREADIFELEALELARIFTLLVLRDLLFVLEERSKIIDEDTVLNELHDVVKSADQYPRHRDHQARHDRHLRKSDRLTYEVSVDRIEKHAFEDDRKRKSNSPKRERTVGKRILQRCFYVRIRRVLLLLS